MEPVRTELVDALYSLGTEDAHSGRVLHPEQIRAIFTALKKTEPEIRQATEAYCNGYAQYASDAYQRMAVWGYADS